MEIFDILTVLLEIVVAFVQVVVNTFILCLFLDLVLKIAGSFCNWIEETTSNWIYG